MEICKKRDFRFRLHHITIVFVTTRDKIFEKKGLEKGTTERRVLA
jgi:hypothetical protein